MAYIITAIHQNKKITRTAYSDFQAFTIINLLYREGCTEIGMREEVEEQPYCKAESEEMQAWITKTLHYHHGS